MAGRPLNATAASLLGFLHEGPKTGWDLVTTAQERIGKFWSLTTSQVYRELSAMERDGLIEAGETGPRARKPYALTDDGRRAFADWLERDPGPENIRHPLLLTVAFAEHLPAHRLVEILAHYRAEHERQLAEYEQLLASHVLPDYPAATVEFGIAYERAVLSWLRGMDERIVGAVNAADRNAPTTDPDVR
ncbi:MAG: PadR family transcriptional regulator [Rhodococcus sp. (in: high G+C Gram-positive bacteria)]|uniref:PadR family transcriptional regulator n=1 Tax=Rhodococcus sp. TaxID=1831 RepID=UPI003D9B00DC